MPLLRRVFLGALLAFVPAVAHAQVTFNGVGVPSAVRDATKVDSIIYAVGGSNVGASLWTWDGANPVTLTQLPDFPGGTGGAGAFAITPTASHIAGQARSSTGAVANRVTRSGLLNLNLNTAPYTSFSSGGSARAISDDGSIVYGAVNSVASPNNRIARFNVAAETSTLVTQPPNTAPVSLGVGRSASADGSVMVATSFNSGLGGTIYRYVFDTPAGTPSMVPQLSVNATWSKALGVSSDGNLTLAAGNSFIFPKGALYLYNSETAAITFLGSPNSAWGPAGTAGMTSDGSVVAVSFAALLPNGSAPANGTRNAYFHNSRGWFQLTTALLVDGVNLSAGWDNLTINGVSSDGALVFGQGRHNNVNEGFVAAFPSGFLAEFDVPAVAPSDQSIIGTWIFPDDNPDVAARNPVVMALLADGTYYHVEANSPASEAGGGNGFERGRYTWDAQTGAFFVATLHDTNGDIGFSNLNGANTAGLPMAGVSGDELTFTLQDKCLIHPVRCEHTIVGTRITGSTDSLVAGWALESPLENGNAFLLVLLDDGVYYLAGEGSIEEPDTCRSGIAKGTYAWDPTTGVALSAATVETDGGCGLLSPDLWALSPDGLVLAMISDDYVIYSTRVVAPSRVMPIITSPSAATGALGAPFAYAITADHAAFTFNALGLPPGLAVNSATGAISGTPSEAGLFGVTITASNSLSTGTATLDLMIVSITRTGFYEPVSPVPTYLNTVKGGSTVPLKFNVYVDGIEKTDTSGLVFSVAPMPCSGGTEDAVDFVTTESTELRYSGHEFIQNWKTPKGAGACYIVRITTTTDGGSLSALFKMK